MFEDVPQIIINSICESMLAITIGMATAVHCYTCCACHRVQQPVRRFNLACTVKHTSFLHMLPTLLARDCWPCIKFADANAMGDDADNVSAFQFGTRYCTRSVTRDAALVQS